MERPMQRILIVYAMTRGWTGRIVDRMAADLRGMGLHPSVYQAEEAGGLDLDAFDGVLLAGSVHFGRHQRVLEDFARDHAGDLTLLPSAFLSVCGALAGSWPGCHAEAAKYREDFARRTGWRPEMSWSVAGRVAYTEYPLPLRLVMQFISWRTGRPTDTSRDWEFTDWMEVERLARAFGWAVREAARPATVPVEWGTSAGRSERDDTAAEPRAGRSVAWAERVRSEGWAAGIGWPDG